MHIRILLPSVIRILRDRANQSIHTDHSELHLYYQNFIQPYHAAWDIQVQCAYGQNLGNCWYIKDSFPRNVDSFPLEIRVFDEEGVLLAEKGITVRLYDASYAVSPFSVMFFGDSMTQSAKYVTHVATRLCNIRTVGTRSFNELIRLEGRGGWSMSQYLGGMRVEDCMPTSPFVFPKSVAGEEYWGDEKNWANVADPHHDTYCYDGYRYEECKENMTFLRAGKLYRKTAAGEELLDTQPEGEFSFVKYAKRHHIAQLGAISVLMGANDLQCIPYAKTEETVSAYIKNLQTLVGAVREYSKNTAIIINMPVLGSEQYHWGVQLGCYATAKQYRHNILAAAAALIEAFDGREEEGIYLCPMVAVLDPENGFDTLAVHPTVYSEGLQIHHANWVHPNQVGYCQMGDALAAVVEAVRQKSEM